MRAGERAENGSRKHQKSVRSMRCGEMSWCGRKAGVAKVDIIKPSPSSSTARGGRGKKRGRRTRRSEEEKYTKRKNSQTPTAFGYFRDFSTHSTQNLSLSLSHDAIFHSFHTHRKKAIFTTHSLFSHRTIAIELQSC